MDLVDLIVEKRDAIKAVCAKYGASAVRIFGSCARDDYDEQSDIDVLIQMPNGLDVFDWIGRLLDIEEELKQLLQVDVDVVDEGSLKGRTRERVLKEAVSL
jgi:predicted nucleotidyltransferase